MCLQGLLFVPLVTSSSADIVSGRQKAKNEYLNKIPCAWVIVNQVQHLFLNGYLLLDMMIFTACVFRVDEYIETAVAQLRTQDLEVIRSLIRTLCADDDKSHPQIENHHPAGSFAMTTPDHRSASSPETNHQPHQTNLSTSSVISSVRAVLASYIDGTLSCPRIQQAAPMDSLKLRSTLYASLLAYIDQLENSARLSRQPNWSPHKLTQFLTPRPSFLNWLHTTGADSVMSTLAFVFMSCLIGGTGPCFKSTTQAYLAQDLCERIAIMCRLPI